MNSKEYEDKELECMKCGSKFVWTAGEQKFYDEKGLENEPKTCPTCRKKREKNKALEVECRVCGSQGHIRLPEVQEEELKNTSIVCKKCADKEAKESGD